MFASETSWRRLQDMSSRRLQDISSRRLEDQQMFAGIREGGSKITMFFFFRPWKSMSKPGTKTKQFFQFLFPNYIQILKKITEDGLVYKYQL